MKLYYSPGACSLADHIALVESGLSFEVEAVDLKAGTTLGGRPFSQINPKGYVPALELDDGEVLTENIAILTYIADRSGKLIAKSGMPYWRTIETTAFISTELHKNFKAFFIPDSTDADKKAAGEMLLKRFGTLEKQLGNRDFIVGDAFSIADCYLFVMLMWAKTKVGLDLPSGLTRYYDRLAERPAIKQALADEGLA